MIYLFTGNNDFLIKQEALHWKKAFWEKHGSDNVIHISQLEHASKNTISEALLARSIFMEKRLVIIEGFPYSWEKAFAWSSEKETLILETIENISEDLLVVFVAPNPDKRKSWFKKLSKQAETKDFSISWDSQIESILQKKYSGKIESSALSRLIFLKWSNLEKCISEIQKLLIATDKISNSDVNNYIMPEFEVSIFTFIDTILEKKKETLFKDFNNLIENSNLYALYQSIIANLRVFLYIELLKSKKTPVSKIGDILKLWNRAFLVNKKHKSNYNQIKTLYIDLLGFDKNMKFWKFINTDEKDLKQELEKIFLKFLAQ